MKRFYTALSIAGFDGSGGAGIQADLKTFSALGCYGMTVLTALPIQNTQGVKSIYPISKQCVSDQLESIFEDIGIDCIKIGMLHRKEIVKTVSNALKKTMAKIVLDPVMMAKSGDQLLTFEAAETMKKKLFPLVTLLTPNLPEASILIQKEIHTKKQMEQAALEIINQGPKAVLLKGGHFEGNVCEDVLCIDKNFYWFSAARTKTINTHGTGCTLSAAITAFLAQGVGIKESVYKAKKYISQCIEAGSSFKIGRGNGPVHHFFASWNIIDVSKDI